MQNNEKYLCLKKGLGGIEIVIISAFLRTLQLQESSLFKALILKVGSMLMNGWNWQGAMNLNTSYSPTENCVNIQFYFSILTCLVLQIIFISNYEHFI